MNDACVRKKCICQYGRSAFDGNLFFFSLQVDVHIVCQEPANTHLIRQ